MPGEYFCWIYTNMYIISRQRIFPGIMGISQNKNGQSQNATNHFSMKSVRDEIRTHTTERSLPPQSSVSTNSTTRTNINPQTEIYKKNRAKNGTRTRDPNLGKVVLYQLSYFRNSNLFSKIDIFHCSL